MSLPREWSFQESCRMVDRGLGPGPTATASQEAVGPVIDENMNQQNQLGSLFSIHSAPVFDINNGLPSPKRPASLVVQVTATSTPVVPPHISPPETIDDEDNDNLLTISSLTARPLIAKSRELRSSRYRPRTKRPKKVLKPKNPNLIPLDGGYGWVIVFGAFFVQFWVAGLVKSYGVLYVEVMETFKDSSASVASWIPAILSCLCLALGEFILLKRNTASPESNSLFAIIIHEHSSPFHSISLTRKYILAVPPAVWFLFFRRNSAVTSTKILV